ncbi:MAG: Zn-dependent hydrolase [Desulfovibrionaceae bacterium]|jgi:N-carbamoyl-L-amino-acid hydrolase|nr:Zn-dependent hydrolase [Desulfovibrionaceae bacterium]
MVAFAKSPGAGPGSLPHSGLTDPGALEFVRAFRPVAERLFADLERVSRPGRGGAADAEEKGGSGAEAAASRDADAETDGPVAGAKAPRGVTRPAYGAVETRAVEVFAAAARAQGLETFYDRAANLVFQLPGMPDPNGGAAGGEPAVYVGSHLDSVPHGGNYDGAAGCVAALLCLARHARAGTRPPVPVRGIVLRGEESAWFGDCYLGSRALFGDLDAAALGAAQRDTRRPLREYMAAAGADMAAIERGETLLDPARVAAFLELHIEQGPVMVARNLPVAAVTGIRGNVRHRRVQCVGEAGHSGAVPRWLRRDAVFAVSDLIVRLDDHWTTIEQHGGDLVMTVGMLSTDPAHHAMTRIPGEAAFTFEARSQHAATLSAVEALLHSECATLEQDRRVRFVFDAPVRTAPARLDQGVTDSLLHACAELGLPTEAVPSGAGHDAAVFANQGIPSGMLFVRNEHGSHNPDEAMDLDDFLAGVAVLDRTLSEAS